MVRNKKIVEGGLSAQLDKLSLTQGSDQSNVIPQKASSSTEDSMAISSNTRPTGRYPLRSRMRTSDTAGPGANPSLTPNRASNNLSASASSFVPQQQALSVSTRVLDRLWRVNKSSRKPGNASSNLSKNTNTAKSKKWKQGPEGAANSSGPINPHAHAPVPAAALPLRQAPRTGPSRQRGTPSFTASTTPRRRNSATRRVHMLERPAPAPLYIQLASQAPRTLSAPRALLIVVDLNGTLLKRSRYTGDNKFTPRPYLKEFLSYVLEKHKLMIWSSARPENVAVMCSNLFTPEQREQLIAVWARDRLGLSKEAYNEKVQVYKQLLWVWSEESIQADNPHKDESWSQANTVLVDDSVEKAASEPYNLVELEEFRAQHQQIKSDDYLLEVKDYLQILSAQADVSAYMRLHPFKHSSVPTSPESTTQGEETESSSVSQHVFFTD